MIDIVKIIGLNLQEANDFCMKNNLILRVARTNDYNHILTRDYKTNRVNVWITNGFINKAYIG